MLLLDEFSRLQSISEYLKTDEGTRIFGTRSSIDWFIRVNKIQLIKDGALVRLRNQWQLLRPQYDQSIVEIGKCNAKKVVGL